MRGIERMVRNISGNNSTCVCFSGYDYYTEDDKCSCKKTKARMPESIKIHISNDKHGHHGNKEYKED